MAKMSAVEWGFLIKTTGESSRSKVSVSSTKKQRLRHPLPFRSLSNPGILTTKTSYLRIEFKLKAVMASGQAGFFNSHIKMGLHSVTGMAITTNRSCNRFKSQLRMNIFSIRLPNLLRLSTFIVLSNLWPLVASIWGMMVVVVQPNRFLTMFLSKISFNHTPNYQMLLKATRVSIR